MRSVKRALDKACAHENTNETFLGNFQTLYTKCYFTPPKSQFYDGIFYQVVKWFSRGLSGTLSGCIPPELARDGLEPREVEYGTLFN